jgi:8-oxo-dGTP pyrophosphatase MutT (NUDIX family)
VTPRKRQRRVAHYAAVGFLYHPASGQVLLHRRDGNTTFYPRTWAGFGGSNEPEDGGDPAATWRREMREELGIALSPDQIRPIRSYVNPEVGRWRHTFYAAWPSPDDQFALTEGDGYAWFPLAEAIELPDLMRFARDDLLELRELVDRDRHPTTPPLVTNAQEDGGQARAERP